MEGVVVPVSTLLVATTVHVPQDAHWTPMVMLAMVSCGYTKNNSITIESFSENNECSAGTDNCAQNCYDITNCGGFSCSCNTGYSLDSNNYSCSGL